MNIEKRKNFLINFFYFGLLFGILYFVFKYGMFWFMPFVIGFGIAYLLKPLINFISKKLHAPRKPIAALCVLFFYGTAGILFVTGTIRLFAAASDVFSKLPDFYYQKIEPTMVRLFEYSENYLAQLDPAMINNITDMITSFIQSLGTIVTKMSSSALGIISGVAGSVPTVLIAIVFTIIATFFTAMDYYKITGFILKQFSDKGRNIIYEVKNYITGSLVKFIKAYGIIMAITFLELSIGLTILGVKNSILVALLIAFVDILPVLGTGGVVIPWLIIEFTQGNVSFGIGLTVLYVVITVIRNILEPKVVGGQVGLHPLLMLICMFIGARLFGVLGIFILPIIIIIVKNLNDTGKIHLFKS